MQMFAGRSAPLRAVAVQLGINVRHKRWKGSLTEAFQKWLKPFVLPGDI